MLASVTNWLQNALNPSSTPAQQPALSGHQPRVIEELDEATNYVISTKTPLASGYDGRVWRLDSGLIYKQSFSIESLDSILSEMLAYSLLEYVVNRFECLGPAFKVFCTVKHFYLPADVWKVYPELCALIRDPAPIFDNLNPRITSEHNTATLETLLKLAEPHTASELFAVRSYVDKYNMLIGNTQDVDPDIFDIETRISTSFGSDDLCAGFFMEPYLNGLENFLNHQSLRGALCASLKDTVNLLTYLFQNVILLRLIHGAHLDFKPSNLFIVPDEPVPDSLKLKEVPDLRRVAFRVADFSRFIFIKPYAVVHKPPVCYDESNNMDEESVRGNLMFSSRALLADAVPAFTDDFESILLLTMVFVAGSLIYEPQKVVSADNKTSFVLPIRKDTPVKFSTILEDMFAVRCDQDKMRAWFKKFNVRTDVIDALTSPLQVHRQKLELLFWNLFEDYCIYGAVSIYEEPVSDQLLWDLPVATADDAAAAVTTAVEQPPDTHVDWGVRTFLAGEYASAVRARRAARNQQSHISAKSKRKFTEEIIGLPRRNKSEVRVDPKTKTSIHVLKKFSSYKGWDPVMYPWVGHLPAEGVTKRARKPPVWFNPYSKK